MLERFTTALEELIGHATPAALVVGLSGGADSTALAVLASLWRQGAGVRLMAAHLNHGLRGPAALADETAARSLAKAWGLEFVSQRLDVAGLAKARGLGLEEAGRQARYAFFEQVRAQAQADFVLTGHTADDNAEAVLLNLVRGAGPRGLAGIPALGANQVARPLLGFHKRELTAWLNAQGIPWREDMSNQDTRFRRNYLRHLVLPLLKELNPALVQTLTRTAEVLAREEDFWAAVVENMKPDLGWRVGRGEVLVRREPLAQAHPALARRVVRAMFETASGSLASLGLTQVEDILALAKTRTGHKRLSLPGGWRAFTLGPELGLARQAPAGVADHAQEISLSGTTAIPALHATLTARQMEKPPGFDVRAFSGFSAALDLEALSPPLILRAPRPGDRLRPLGMRGEKKLSDFYIDRRVPRPLRPRRPVLADSGGIVWVAGVGLAERARVEAGTRRLLILEYRDENADWS